MPVLFTKYHKQVNEHDSFAGFSRSKWQIKTGFNFSQDATAFARTTTD